MSESGTGILDQVSSRVDVSQVCYRGSRQHIPGPLHVLLTRDFARLVLCRGAGSIVVLVCSGDLEFMCCIVSADIRMLQISQVRMDTVVRQLRHTVVRPSVAHYTRGRQ